MAGIPREFLEGSFRPDDSYSRRWQSLNNRVEADRARIPDMRVEVADDISRDQLCLNLRFNRELLLRMTKGELADLVIREVTRALFRQKEVEEEETPD